MKSLCIKTNHSQASNYLLKQLENSKLDDTYISIKEFKHFNNIIIHYLSTEYTKLYTCLSNIITRLIISVYEKDLIYRKGDDK